MIDYDLLKVNIPTDITSIFEDYDGVLVTGARIDDASEIFKWYHSTGWQFTYDVSIVFRTFIRHADFENIKWWYENELPRDYSLIEVDDFIFNRPEILKYFLDAMATGNTEYKINYFDCVEYITNDMDYSDDDTGIENLHIFTDFCLDNNVKFDVANVVYDCLYPMIDLYKLINEKKISDKIYNLFFDNFLYTVNSRVLTNKEISGLHLGYLLPNCFDSLPPNVLQYVESILELPIYISLLSKKCTSDDYNLIIKSLYKNKLMCEKLISDGKIICDVDMKSIHEAAPLKIGSLTYSI